MAVLVRDSVKRTLFTMAFPMLAGTFAMNAYNFTDTWFVAQLGTLPLAAMGFAFPVLMLLTCVARGLGIGVTTLVSHAIGRNDHAGAARLVTHGMALTVAATAVMSVVGYLSIKPVFTWLGADAKILPLVGEYMRIWYVGSISMALPMLGNGILLSAGDSKAASRFMMLGAGLNVILDPIMIFGYLGCPAMGIRGAALATVIAQGVSTLWLLQLLSRKHRLLVFRNSAFRDYLTSIRKTIGIGIPSILSMILMPMSASVFTWILSGFGHEAVAAGGAAGRLEMFAFVIPMALGISLTPFISQNYGASRLDRIREAATVSTRFALLYGAVMTVVFFALAPWVASFFSKDPKVVATMVSYLRIISFGYGIMEAHRYCGFILTGLHRPVSATALNAIRVVGLLIPLSLVGARVFGVRGVFAGRLAADIVAGSIGLVWVSRAFGSVSPQTASGLETSGKSQL